MPSFEIDTPQLVIEPSGSLQVGISNSANQARTCRLEIASEDAEAAGWIAISPWQERNLQPNERSEITLSLTLPPGAAAGPRRFRLLAVEVSNPDEDVARSPDFRFEVPGSGGGGKLPLWPFIAAGVAALLLVIGVGAYLFWPVGTAQVPGLSGLTLAAAEARLEAEDLAVGRVDRRESGSVTPGTVLAQDPGEGAELAPGSAVALTVATEPARAEVPNLVGLSQDKARNVLRDRGLRMGGTETRESGSVAPGTVLAQNPGEGVELAPGSAVALTVATEPARAEVPNLVGLSQDRARNVLRARGLRMGGTATRESGSVAPGTVLAQDPGEGVELAPGSAVAVVLAAAPRVTVDEDCIRHNPGNIAAKQIGGRWKIVDGSHWMLDFGTDADSAKKVLAVLKAYGADRICYVSRPQPPMMYILNGDRAPIRTPATRLQLMTAGLVREDCIGFDPATLDLESGGAGVTLVSDRGRMIRFRNMDEAKKAMLVIRKHGFTRQCFVGRPNPEFKYFLR
ncbi:PASTA domain-containing protein [Rhodovulum sulfidophilum]|uniref:PASTA domain-containing protein n=1 Tax=Rhodovulum sulfidophilum TaxID=35806 RepID=UPI001F1C46A2|nr:PASTA domain-containing protein [Rhodovulum sulfidophilum]MCE8439113.1 PASTA domain-containing protein [Rhodovulum sulfidophilum]